MVTVTSPTMAPFASRSGTRARAEGPDPPISTARTVRPASTAVGSVPTRWPINSGRECDRRIPRRLPSTTFDAPVARRIASARRCTKPPRSLRATAATSSGVIAIVRAMPSARISYSRSRRPRAAYSASSTPTTSVPTRIRTWSRRIWVDSRRDDGPMCRSSHARRGRRADPSRGLVHSVSGPAVSRPSAGPTQTVRVLTNSRMPSAASSSSPSPMPRTQLLVRGNTVVQ
jgi:hypothetical protein